jgi:hypothetical protein
MLTNLSLWSDSSTRPSYAHLDVPAQLQLRQEAAARKAKLQESKEPIKVQEKFMGRW